jgi:hypothetical protein
MQCPNEATIQAHKLELDRFGSGANPRFGKQMTLRGIAGALAPVIAASDAADP